MSLRGLLVQLRGVVMASASYAVAVLGPVVGVLGSPRSTLDLGLSAGRCVPSRVGAELFFCTGVGAMRCIRHINDDRGHGRDPSAGVVHGAIGRPGPDEAQREQPEQGHAGGGTAEQHDGQHHTGDRAAQCRGEREH